MSNVAGKAYGMIVITPLAKRLGWTNKWVFRFGRSFPGILAGLIGLKFIHFARWVIIPKDAWPTLTDKNEKWSNENYSKNLVPTTYINTLMTLIYI